MAVIARSPAVQRLNGNNNSNGIGPADFAPNQAERWLCAEPVDLSSGTASSVTLRAKQQCWVDLSRLVIQSFATEEEGGALELNPFNSDLNAYTFIQQITFKGNQKMVQGTASSGNTTVDCPASFFSPARDITGWHMMGSGEWFEMNTQDTIVISAIQTSAVGGKILAAAPIVLDCDVGQSAYPRTIQVPGAGSWTGSQAIASTQSDATANGTAISLDLTLNQAGSLNWNAMVISGAFAQGTPSATGIGLTRLPFTTSYLTSLTNFTSEEMLQGVPDNSGNDIALPLGVYAPPGLSGYDRAGYPWARLAVLSGSSGNSASMSINSSSYPGPGTSRILSAAAPFFGTPQDPLACR